MQLLEGDLRGMSGPAAVFIDHFCGGDGGFHGDGGGYGGGFVAADSSWGGLHAWPGWVGYYGGPYVYG